MNKLKFLMLLLLGCYATNVRTLAQCAPIADPCANVITMSPIAPASPITRCQGDFLSFSTTVNWAGLIDSRSFNSTPPLISVLNPFTNTITSSLVVAPGTNTYCVNTRALGPNIIRNGNFSSGAVCFTQDAPYVLGGFPGTGNMCQVCPSITWITGTLGARSAPNMLVVNASTAPIPPFRSFWNQSVNVCPGSNYQFQAFYSNINGPANAAQRAQIYVQINATTYGPFSTTTNNTWTQIQFNWLATGPVANIRIFDSNNLEWLNDFGIDDISLRRISTAQRCVTITGLPTPVASGVRTSTCSPVCPGTPITIKITGTPGATVNYTSIPTIPGVTPGSVVLPASGITFVTVTPTIGSGIFDFIIQNATMSGLCPRVINQHIPVVIGLPTATLWTASPCPGVTFTIPVTGTPGAVVTVWDGLTTYTTTIPPSGIGSVTITGGITVPTTFCITGVSNCSCPNPGPFMCVTIIPRPGPAKITGLNVVCRGSSITLSATPSGGVWGTTSSGVSLSGATSTPASVVVTGIVIGSTNTITYTRPTGCGPATATFVVTVIGPPTVGAISGPTPSIICPGTTGTFTNPTPGGVWSSSNSSVATIDPTTGVATGVMPGSTTIDYTVTNACGRTKVSIVLNIPKPVALQPIRNLPKLCAGQTVTLPTPIGGGSGGVWTSSTSSVATVHPTTGTVTAVSAGTSIITYTLVGPCNTATVSVPVTVYPSPTITGPTVICGSSTITLSADVPGGTWMSSNTTVATIDENLGDVFPVATGSTIITYTTANGCIDTAIVNVLPDTTVCPYYDYSVNAFVIPGAPGATVDYMLGVTYPGVSWFPTIYTCTAPPCYLPPIGFTCVQIVGYTYMGCTSSNSCIACVNPVKPGGNNTTNVTTLSNENELNSISLTPNPNSGEFMINSATLQINEDSQLPLEVVNMLGQVVYSDVAVVKNGKISKNIRLDGKFANGMYIVRIKHEQATRSIRFVLER